MNETERKILLAIAEVLTPAGAVLPAPGEATVEAVRSVLGHVGPRGEWGYRALLRLLDLASVPTTGRRLSALDIDRRRDVLTNLYGGSTYWAIRAVAGPLKLAQAAEPALERALGVASLALPMVRETKRWEQQIVDARTLEPEERFDVDAVVVGTGAGGAPVARALAAAGYAVLMIEEGGHFTRADFGGRPLEMHRKLYRSRGLTFAVGNTVIPVPMGKSVGGTTTINSGTCFRAPDHVMRRWQLEEGLFELGPGSLDGYYERVESMLQVAPSPPEILGGMARIIARGCDALGFSHAALPRNAPGCEGKGVCCFGCPTDAKRSTNVSYVPAALERGAMVLTHARVTQVLTRAARATGVVATTRRQDGSRGLVTVRAKVVVLACGTVHTPALLLKNGLANGSGQLGRHLTIHPASHAWATFDEEIRGWAAVPQGYGVDAFADQGIRFEGGFLPVHIAAMFLNDVGRRWTEIVERFDRLGHFGFMIADSSRGRVTLGPRGAPRMSYWVNDADRLKMIRAHGILARIFLAAGARAVYPGLQIFDRLESIRDVEELERRGPRRLRAHHIEISAYHPLGTCAMGPDPATSVIGPSHETHEVESLFVCDGSAVPGPLGVNPQVTIMAMSERASEIIERRIEHRVRASASQVERRSEPRTPVAEFFETMAGSCSPVLSSSGSSPEGSSLCAPNAAVASLAFHVKASLYEQPSIGALLSKGAMWQLEGTLDWQDAAHGALCHGTLLMRPMRGTAGLVYDLTFVGDNGERYELHGEKHLSVKRPVRGMTTLHTELIRSSDGAAVARGVLRFDLGHLRPWLRSWRVGRGVWVRGLLNRGPRSPNRRVGSERVAPAMPI